VEREVPTALPEAEWDARVYAISPGSESFLRALDAWPSEAERMAPIEHMRIFGDRPNSKLEFDAYASRVARRAPSAFQKARQRNTSGTRSRRAWSRKRRPGCGAPSRRAGLSAVWQWWRYSMP